MGVSIWPQGKRIVVALKETLRLMKQHKV